MTGLVAGTDQLDHMQIFQEAGRGKMREVGGGDGEHGSQSGNEASRQRWHL